MIKKIILAVLLCQFTFAQEILNLKDRATLIEKIQKDRLDNLLPELMSKNGIDMWIIITSCLLYTSPSPRDRTRSRMPSSA